MKNILGFLFHLFVIDAVTDTHKHTRIFISIYINETFKARRNRVHWVIKMALKWIEIKLSLSESRMMLMLLNFVSIWILYGAYGKEWWVLLVFEITVVWNPNNLYDVENVYVCSTEKNVNNDKNTHFVFFFTKRRRKNRHSNIENEKSVSLHVYFYNSANIV